jgi:hypothetical protein
LTAAHVVYGLSTSDIIVLLGDLWRSLQYPTTSYVNDCYRHGNAECDVALLELARPWPTRWPLFLNESVPSLTRYDLVGASVTAEGEGCTADPCVFEKDSGWPTSAVLTVSSVHLDKWLLAYVNSRDQLMAPGDSGTPWLYNINGEMVIAGMFTQGDSTRSFAEPMDLYSAGVRTHIPASYRLPPALVMVSVGGLL